MARPQLNSSITLADVADRAKVSVMTASRALRQSPVVAAQTRRRVHAAARFLGYTPNLLARALVQSHNPTIGVVVHDLSYPFFVPVIGALQEAAERAGFLVVVSETKRALATEVQIMRRLRDFRVAGIAVHPATQSFAHLDEIRRGGLPVVAFAREWRGGDCIAVNNVGGAAEVARHLLRRGFRDVGLVTSSDPDNRPVLDREQSFLAALAQAGVSIPARWRVVSAGTSFEEGRRAADLLLDQAARPRAVFCVNDRLSLGFINRCRQLGYAVPRDIAVIGFDDLAFADYTEVPLTTMAVPTRRIGEDVARLLFARIAGNGPRKVALRSVSPKLIIRNSCL